MQPARFETDPGLVQALDIDLPTTRRPVGISTRRGARPTPAAQIKIAARRQV